MTTPPNELMDRVRRDLAAWHATHPRATFAELEGAVEEQVRYVRKSLLRERTDALRETKHPACPQCGSTMVPRTRSTRRVVSQGEQVIPIERSYVVCPACETGLFPPCGYCW